MRLLADTNIFISLEGNDVLSKSVADLARLTHSNGHKLMVHPASLEDIRRDSDLVRQKINESKIRKYPFLESPPMLSLEEEMKLRLSANTPNDQVDNQILHAVAQNAVDILITEDRRIHTKARALGVSGRVHYLQQAVEFLHRMHEGQAISLPSAIQTTPLHNIKVDIPFFNSLRESYPEFNVWYHKVAKEGRRAWVISNDSGAFGAVTPRAIVIYKEESDPSFDNQKISGKGLKLCAFRVGEGVRGRKIGELFLKTAMEHARQAGLEFIFITMQLNKRENQYLEDLCIDFGFQKIDTYKGKDDVFIKKQPSDPPLRGELTPFQYHRMHSPLFFAGEKVGKFIVPIQPRYHEILFPETQRQIPLAVSLPESAGNAIKKAYLCRAQTRQIQTGDVLLFYRSGDSQAITTIGIVEKAEILTGCDRIMSMVSKRTVYSYEEVEKGFGNGETLVLLFRVARHLGKNEVAYERLKEIGAVSGPIQSIQNISHPKFLEIADEARFRNCFCLD